MLDKLDGLPLDLPPPVQALLKQAGEAWHSEAEAEAKVLEALALGSVFMGANTYIGNGPNFLVKSIAEERGVRMPSFFGYMAYSGLILVPVFLLVTWIFL